MMLLTPKGFLQIGGVVLVLVGILGFVGVLGPTPDKSIFGSPWWFDNAENWAHLVLGVVGLAASFVLKPPMQKGLVLLLGVVGVLVGLLSLFGVNMLLGANLENPADTILHIVVGVWALAASRGAPGGASQPAKS